MTIFVLIILIYNPYLNFKSTYTLNIYRLLTRPSVKLYIFTMAFMLNFLWLLVKWIRWYFLGVNITLYWRVYIVYILYTLFRALQFFSMVLLYISILELLTNLNAEVVSPCSSSRSVYAKNRNKIGDSAKP